MQTDKKIFQLMTREMIRVIILLGLKEKLVYINKLLLLRLEYFGVLNCLRCKWNSLCIHLFCFQKHLCLFISA